MAEPVIFYTVLNPDRTVKYSMFTADSTYEPTNGEFLVKDVVPEHDYKWQKVTRVEPVPEGDSMVYIVEDIYSPEEKIKVEENQARSMRNDYLQRSDHYMFSDYPITEEERSQWATYRQLLRDVPQQDGFPSNIVWPTKPGE